MNRIAFIIGENFLYWNSIVLVLAAVSAICMFLALQLGESRNWVPAVSVIPLAAVLSLVFSRLVHWYCRPQGYAGLGAALGDFSRGGYALIGVFAGCLLAALVLWLCKVVKNLPGMLDHMAIAGSLGLCVGRLGDLFTSSDRGMHLPDSVPFPFASQLVSSVSGEVESRLAVFMLQSLVAGALFAVLLVFYLRGRDRGTLRRGDTCLIFTLCYGASQAILDSPRYDSLYFRSNGFVSIVQIFSVLAVLTVIVWFTVRMLKAGKKKLLWLPLLNLPLLGCAGYMEYHVQRHGGQALFAYSVMTLCMTAVVVVTLLVRCQGTGGGTSRQEAHAHGVFSHRR